MLFKRIIKWRRKRNVPIWKDFHVSIAKEYFSFLSTTCDFPDKQLKEMLFMVPRLMNKFQESQNGIKKCHLVEAFLSFLLRLLYHKPERIVNLGTDQIDKFEKELRFLLTILGDVSWMLFDDNEHESEFQNLLTEFEAVVNQAGSLVHSLIFSTDRAFREMDEGIAAVLYQTDLLKDILQSSICVSACSPRTCTVNSFLIVDSLVDDLEDLLKREDDPIADVKEQVSLLHHELLLSHTSIKEMRLPRPSEIEEVKEAMMHIGGIAHQADYLITTFLVKDAPLWYVFNRLTHLNHRIEPIRKEIQQIALKYLLGGLKVEKYNFSAEPSLQDKRNTEINDVTIGFEGQTVEILDHLIGGGTRSLQIISILGMPGLGKTTLANKLYNHPSVKYRFDKLAWCVVSQTYKRQRILANILIHIDSELGKDRILNMEEISLVEHIHKTLMRRRYLVALDDIWDSYVLDELVRCFPDDGNGSRILLTSRNKDVAPPYCIIHELPFLSDEQCWELLEKKVFGSRICPPQLQEIGKRIAARCCGLPLTVVVISGVLSTVEEEESRWEEVGGSLGSYIDGDDNSVMQILKLSYKHLPDRLKPCFLYFGEFKEDEEISVEKLKRLWVAEGFIRKEKDERAENIAGEYLMELIDRSLVMIAKRKIGGRAAKSCVVHDLLRDLCLKISKEESFLIYLNNDCHTIYEKGHRVRAFGDSANLSYCPHARSFVGDCSSLSLYARDMRLLRVLYFNRYYSLMGTFGIEYLVNLRFLIIQNFPTWIEKFLNLEYIHVLELRSYLPPTIVKLKKLRFIRGSNVEYSEEWNICNQTNNLEYLSTVIIRELKDEELLKCSPYLRILKCRYDQDDITKSAYPRFDLFFLTQLHSLTLSGHLRKKDFGFPSNIRKLTLRVSSLPWEKMSIVGRLEFLEVLKLSDRAFVGERWDTRDGEFQKLSFLQLDCINLSEWDVASNEHFPELQQLILIDCWRLQEIPSEFGEITTLELIEVRRHCQKSVVESAERIKEEQLDMGNEELRVIINTC